MGHSDWRTNWQTKRSGQGHQYRSDEAKRSENKLVDIFQGQASRTVRKSEGSGGKIVRCCNQVIITSAGVIKSTIIYFSTNRRGDVFNSKISSLLRIIAVGKGFVLMSVESVLRPKRLPSFLTIIALSFSTSQPYFIDYKDFFTEY